MNRKQRRAKGIKNNDPAVCLKKSETRSYIDGLVHNDPKVQKAILEEAHRVQLLEAKAQAEDIDALILVNLYQVFGFGKTRLMRFVKGLVELQKYYEDKYDDCGMLAIKNYLKDYIGIDVHELQKEVEKFADEENSDKG